MKCDLCGVEGEHNCIYRESCPECGDKPFQGQIDCYMCYGSRQIIRSFSESERTWNKLLEEIDGLC